MPIKYDEIYRKLGILANMMLPDVRYHWGKEEKAFITRDEIITRRTNAQYHREPYIVSPKTTWGDVMKRCNTVYKQIKTDERMRNAGKQ